MHKIILKDVGRSKVSREIEIAEKLSDEQVADRAYREVRRHLLSSEVDLAGDGKEFVVEKGIKTVWTVLVGGFRPVGEVEIITYS